MILVEIFIHTTLDIEVFTRQFIIFEEIISHRLKIPANTYD